MGAHQIDLKLANLLACNADIGQLAHARCDRVRNAIFRDQRIHYGEGTVDILAGVSNKQDGTALDRDFPNLLESKIFSADVQSVQKSFLFLVSGFGFLLKRVLISPPLPEILSKYSAAASRASFLNRGSCVWSRLPPELRDHRPAPVRSQNESWTRGRSADGCAQ